MQPIANYLKTSLYGTSTKNDKNSVNNNKNDKHDNSTGEEESKTFKIIDDDFDVESGFYK